MNERALFEAALEIRDPAERSAYLDLACVNQPELRSRVEELLEAHDAAGSFLNVPAAGHSSPPDRTTDFSFQPTLVEDEGDDKISLSFLQPSTQPGSLGKLAHYEILQILGQGAFGIVFKGFDEKLHRMIAIKVMHPQLAATSPPRKRFLREARAAAAVQHENIVQVHSVEEQPLPYLSMEFIDGETLQQKLDGVGPLSTAEVLHLSRQIAAGLAAAHEKGLIHRDIKPGNILLERGPEQKVKITDFGLARAADDASMTQSGMVCGTPMYMAPEQALGQPLDHRADLFSFGSVLYQMACGRPPFRAPTAIAVLRRVAEETPRPLREVLPEVPDWLAAIVTKLHAKSPDERYQSAKEVRDLLGKCQTELQLHGKVTCVPLPAPPVQLVVAPSPAMVPSPVVATPTRKSNHALLAIAVALLLLLAGFAASEFTGRTNLAGFFDRRDAAPTPQQVTPVATIGWHGWPADAPPPAIAPFNAEQAQQHQEAWAKYLGVPVEYTNTLGMKFRLIPPGEFLMGSTPEEIDVLLRMVKGDKGYNEIMNSHGPQHQVRLTQPAYLGVHEVTQLQYGQIMGETPNYFSSTGIGKDLVVGMDTAQHPQDGKSWNECTEFCTKLSDREKLQPHYRRVGEEVTLSNGNGYCLPAEALWEYSCRAGSTTRNSISGRDEDLAKEGWFDTNAGLRTHRVGELASNAFGIYDMHGNVWEWVQDMWSLTYYYDVQDTVAVDSAGTLIATSHRVIRGGSLFDDAYRCMGSSRDIFTDTAGKHNIGFRVALSVDAVRQALKVTGPALPKPPVPVPANANWTNLFDGTTTTGWKTLGPFQVEAGLLKASEHGVAVTEMSYDNFELELEWRVVAGGNSGVYYRANPEKLGTSYTFPGTEFQLLDNAQHPDGQNPKTSAGALYGVIPPEGTFTKPAGEWNTSRIVARGPQVEHWVNAQKVLSYDMDSDAWRQALTTAKNAVIATNAASRAGVIALQGHTGEIAFRQIRIREIPAMAPKATASKFPPLAPGWFERVSKLPPEEQVKEVSLELKRRNPKWDEKLDHRITDRRIDLVIFDSSKVNDIMPLSVLTQLVVLDCHAVKLPSRLTDLSPLAGMKNLLHFAVDGCTDLTDISPLRDAPLITASLNGTAITDLSPLAGKQLRELYLEECPELTDLSPLKAAPLHGMLCINWSRIRDLSPLRAVRVGNLVQRTIWGDGIGKALTL